MTCNPLNQCTSKLQRLNFEHAADPEDETCSAYEEPAKLCLFDASHPSRMLATAPAQCDPGRCSLERRGVDMHLTPQILPGTGHMDVWHNITKELQPQQ